MNDDGQSVISVRLCDALQRSIDIQNDLATVKEAEGLAPFVINSSQYHIDTAHILATVSLWRRTAVFNANAARVSLEEHKTRHTVLEEEATEWRPINALLVAHGASRHQDTRTMLEVRESQGRQRVIDAYLQYQEWISPQLESSKIAALNKQRQREDEVLRRAAAIKAMEQEISKEERERQERSRRNLELLRAQEEAKRIQREADERQREVEAAIARRKLAAEATKFEQDLRTKESEIAARAAHRESERRAALQELADEEARLQSRLKQMSTERATAMTTTMESFAAEEALVQERMRAREEAQREANAIMSEHAAAEEALLRERILQRDATRAEERRLQLLQLAQQEEDLLARRQAAEHSERIRRDHQLAREEAEIAMRQSVREQADRRALEDQLAFVRRQEEKLYNRLASTHNGAPPPYAP